MTRKSLQTDLRTAMQKAREQALKDHRSPQSPAVTQPEIALAAIVLPSNQPRRHFDAATMQDLTESIRHSGVLQPVLLRPLPDGRYELVAGERRYRAAQAAGLRTLPALVRAMGDQESREAALVENLQREDLNAVDETEAIVELLSVKLRREPADVVSLLHRLQNESAGRVSTQNVLGSEEAKQIEHVFQTLGRMRWPSFVKSRLPLLQLPDDLLAHVRGNRLHYTKAREIARVKDTQTRHQITRDAMKTGCGLPEVRRRVRLHLVAAQAPMPGTAASAPASAPERDLAARLAVLAKQVRGSPRAADPAARIRIDALVGELERLLDPAHLLKAAG